jgi:hypothetical protein
VLRTAMTLYHHPHSSLQKKLWCSGAEPLLFSLKHATLQAPPWHCSLRQADFVSTAASTTYCPIRGVTLIGVIDVVNGCGWGQRLHSRRWHSFGVGGILLAHLFFFIRIAEDDEFIIAGRPKNIAVEVTKESPSELLILRGIRDETFLIRR